MYEEEYVVIFLFYWCVNEMLVMFFCDGIREDFKGILEKSMWRFDGFKFDVNLLFSCL